MTNPAETPKNEMPVVNEAEADAAHDRMMAELFEDLEQQEDAPSAEQEELTKLRKMTGDLGTSLEKARHDNQTLVKQLAAQKEESEQALARTKNQYEEQAAFALQKFLKEVLPVIDTLELGLATVPEEQRKDDVRLDKFADGIEKTIGQLTAVFNKFGIKAINPAKGDAFDEAKNFAATMAEDADVESGAVVKVLQKGYELNGRVVRPATVIVKP